VRERRRGKRGGGDGREQLGKKVTKSRKKKETYFVVQALHLESSANEGGEDILTAMISGIIINK
jgi:hypothetical protein